MKFFIEQIAICPADPAAAEKLLADMGATEWVRDTVTAHGQVFGEPGLNKADLAFNYQLGETAELAGQFEFEILHYTDGPNWMKSRVTPSVSHLGMHCTLEELSQWKRFFSERSISVVQEVVTSDHTNPAITGKRSYCYCIFNTNPILGVDLKFIVRGNNVKS